MTTTPAASYTGQRFPPAIIAQAVGLPFRFPLSDRPVEEILASRGLVVSDEAIREWARKFGPIDAERGTPFAAWLLEVVHHQAGNRLRRQRGRPPLPPPRDVFAGGDGAAAAGRAAGAGAGTDPGGVAEQARRVQATWTTLPAPQREMLERAYYAGLTPQEIAAQLDQPPQTVQT